MGQKPWNDWCGMGSALAQPFTCDVYDKTESIHFFQHLPGYKIANQYFIAKFTVCYKHHIITDADTEFLSHAMSAFALPSISARVQALLKNTQNCPVCQHDSS